MGDDLFGGLYSIALHGAGVVLIIWEYSIWLDGRYRWPGSALEFLTSHCTKVLSTTRSVYIWTISCRHNTHKSQVRMASKDADSQMRRNLDNYMNSNLECLFVQSAILEDKLTSIWFMHFMRMRKLIAIMYFAHIFGSFSCSAIPQSFLCFPSTSS